MSADHNLTNALYDPLQQLLSSKVITRAANRTKADEVKVLITKSWLEKITRCVGDVIASSGLRETKIELEKSHHK